jgi:uncharacterized delta-60 repeat protein
MIHTRIAKCLICVLFISVTVFSQKLVYDNSFTPQINGGIGYMQIQPDQKVLIAGGFTTINGLTSRYLARLNADGSLDTSFNANWLGGPNNQPVSIFSMDMQADGKLLIAGAFPYNNGATLPVRVFRLNADGSPDNTLTSFPFVEIPDDIAGRPRKVQQMPDGKMLVCGNFDTANGNAKRDLARYNADGSYDATFTTALNEDCYDLELLPDGKYLVAGRYSTVNGSPREGLTRFNADGSVDTSFNAATFSNNQTDTYQGIELKSDGTILGFHHYSTNGYLLQLNADGSLLKQYHTLVNLATVLAPGDVELTADGKVLAVGDYFTAGNNVNQGGYFNRFTPDGRHDASAGLVQFGGASNPAIAVEIAADGKVYVAGTFTSVFQDGSISRSFLTRFTPQPVPVKRKYDFDGDGKDDIAVFRPSDRVWYLNQSTNGFYATQFGLSTDKPVAGDYDGDGKADIAVFRDGTWYWLRSTDGGFAYGSTGQAGDIPQRGFNGRFFQNCNCPYTPGLMIFRPSNATFYIKAPFQQERAVDMAGITTTSTDQPVSADFDADGRDDVAVFRNGDWSYLSSNDFLRLHYRFGLAGDKPVPADYDGDGRADYAVFRPSEGVWYIQKSTEGFFAVQWGLSGDLPVPGDYDGDRKTDIAVYRDGFWYILFANGTYRIEKFGLAGDIPVQLPNYN